MGFWVLFVVLESPLFLRIPEIYILQTRSHLIQIGIFIVALVGLCYTVFKGK